MDIFNCHGLRPASSLELLDRKVSAHDSLYITIPKYACRTVAEVRDLPTVKLIPPIKPKFTKLSFWYPKPPKHTHQPLPAAHTQIDGLPNMAPAANWTTPNPGPSVEEHIRTQPADLCESHAMKASDVMRQPNCPTSPVTGQAQTIAKMAEEAEGDRARAPRSRWRADGTRRRTRGERIARALRAEYWKEPAPREESHRNDWWHSRSHDRGYDRDNNWWTYEWACDRKVEQRAPAGGNVATTGGAGQSAVVMTFSVNRKHQRHPRRH